VTSVATAVVLATAPADDGGPAGALPWEDGAVVERLLAQLADLGIPRVHVIGRPGWEEQLERCAERAGVAASVRVASGLSEDFAQVAQVARERKGGLVLAAGEVVTHRAALAGLLANPGIVSGVLGTIGRHGAPFAPPARRARGRLLSAGSAYHSVHAPRIAFLGVIKVAAADQEQFAAVAEQLAELTAGGLPDGWERELQHQVEGWRLALARRVLRGEQVAERAALDQAGRPSDELPALPPAEHAERRRALARELPPEEEAELRRRIDAAREDAASLLVVGLVRNGVHVGMVPVRRLFWARPLSREAAEAAAVEIQDYDEDAVLLDSAVKGSDGFFTTFFVSTWSRYVARWAAHRGLTPNQVTVASLCIGVLAAAGFATGERAGMVAGAVLLYLSFVADCVDGQLARYTRQFSKFGAWLDSIFDRTKEYVAFAGLAIGASASGSSADQVWLLAAIAITLQTVRHGFDFSWGAADREVLVAVSQPPVAQGPDATLARVRQALRGSLEPRLGALEPRTAAAAAAAAKAADMPEEEGRPGRPLARRLLGVWRMLDRLPAAAWVKRMVAFPIGERFAVISITAALATPRTTFVVLLAWGGVGLLYTLAGRTLRSLARR
jgi:phosphatidylglycerophosphate synthase